MRADPLRPPETDEDYPARRRTAGVVLAACFLGLVALALLAWWLR
jgi:hypothetical protein